MDVQLYLHDLKGKLFLDNNWKEIDLTYDWAGMFPDDAGVYAIRKKVEQVIIYVGETGSIRGRMKDLLDSRHHQVRRSLGKHLFSSIEGYKQADSKTKFPSTIEAMLNNHIRSQLEIAHLPVDLGRKELEEFIVRQLKIDSLLNHRGQRGNK